MVIYDPRYNPGNKMVYRDGNTLYWIDGPSREELGNIVRKPFRRIMLVFIILTSLALYMILSGRIPFFGNLTDRIYQSQVQRYYDTRGINRVVDPYLIYDVRHPGKTEEINQD